MTTDKNNTAPDPRPAELAKQQGVSFPLFPRTYYDAFGDGSEPLYTGKQMQDYARAALAATGKQQGGGAQGDSRVKVRVDGVGQCTLTVTDGGIDIPASTIAALAALAARHPSPAGHGAVPCATSASHALRVAYRHLDMVSMRISHCKDAAIIESAMKDVDTFDLNAAISALAARQPGAEADEAAILRHGAAVLDMWEGDPNVTGYMGDFKDACAILEVLALHAAPPAQGIDLGQLERIRNELHAMSGQVPDEWIDPIVELQQDVQKLIDGQRDAAPGVANA